VAYSFTTIAVPGAISTVAIGINDSDQIVGSSTTGGFLYSDGSFTTIDVPGATFTEAFGINDSGQIVGSFRRCARHPRLPGYAGSRAYYLTALSWMRTLNWPCGGSPTKISAGAAEVRSICNSRTFRNLRGDLRVAQLTHFETRVSCAQGGGIPDKTMHFVDTGKPIPRLAQVSKMASTEQVAVLRDKGITAKQLA
jgi:hypothetical protein